MQYSACNYKIENFVAYVTLNRPEKGNALNEQMIAELTMIIDSLSPDIHILYITGAGKHFCTGADLYEMQNNLNDPIKLAHLLQKLHDLNIPIVAHVNGAAFGGAIGLLANCDIVIAQDSSIFCLSEVKLGLVPAIISPYVIEALGIRAAKALMLTAEKISANKALQLGLVHQISTSSELIENLLLNGPKAMQQVKILCREVLKIENTSARAQYTANILSQIRQTPEAQERLKDFFEKKHV